MKYGRFVPNLVANLANFAFATAIGVWLVPYLVRHLGVAAYGLYPLAAGITSYLALFTTVLNSAVGRFMTMAFERNELDEANRIFNTSLWGSVGVLLALAAPCVWFSANASRFLEVPSGAEADFSWLMLSIVGVFYLTTLSSAFSVTAFARNRLDLSSAIQATNTLVRVLVIVALFNYSSPRVWHVGVGLLLAAVCSFSCAVVVSRVLAPALEIRWSWVSYSTLRKVTGMGAWMVINQLGAVLFLSIDLIVVNKVVGAEATGQYAAVMTWSVFLRSFAGVIAGVFAPTVFLLYSRRDLRGLTQYSRRAVKFVGLVMALPIGLVCGFSRPLLQLWLGEEFAGLAPLMSLMTFHLCVNLAVTPLFNLQVAANRVRIPAIVTGAMGLANLGLAILLASQAGWGTYGVAAAGAIVLTVKNLLFTPIYGSRIVGISWAGFYREMLPIAMTTLAVAGLAWAYSTCFSVESWQMLLAGSAGLGVTALGFVFGVVLNRSEREYALRTFWVGRSQPA